MYLTPKLNTWWAYIINDLKIGICEPGIRHASANEPASIDEKFCLVRDAEVFDYIDVTPAPEHVAEFERCAQRHNIPILAGSRNYILGLQEHELFENLRIGAGLGSRVHNTQVFMDHAAGHLVTNDEVMAIYLQAYELGENLGCVPTFETHVNMWSEQFGRVLEVADLVEARGVPFRITLDHSHLIFKIDNPVEQAVFGIEQQVESGELVLDPFQENSIFDQWLARDVVAHCHARSVATNNPKNIWAKHPDINNLRSSLHPSSVVGRGIQYPFIEPKAGEWHGTWRESELAVWKRVTEQVMHYHSMRADSVLQTISTEFIPFTDYGEGSRYSLLENNAACAQWLKDTWLTIKNKT